MTLLETLVVVSLVSVMLMVTYPSLTAGLDGIKLATSADTVVAFLNSAVARAERSHQVVEITISRRERLLAARTADPKSARELHLPDGIRIAAILPEAGPSEDVRRFYLLPGGTVPRIGVELRNPNGARRLVRVDPITGAPEIQR